MLSVVVVGRNDNHGYNLGKRVASSLNSISMRLREGDELIFVDWNTPRPFPPMPISIIDDLTEQTKKFLRILVVDPKIHDEVKGISSKMILEPIARNVGIRRSNPGNHWILSTNTDILFIGDERLSFQTVVKNLDNRLWQAFRYEIPEYIWETLDKRNPEETNDKIMKLLKRSNFKLNLTTNPTEKSKEVFADAIGDFQLAPRFMWESIKGFPEGMLDGWHVDSRAAMQMIRHSGLESKILDGKETFETYHQNHLRNLTHFHVNSVMNSTELIEQPYLNRDDWGLQAENVSEFFLTSLPAFPDHFFGSEPKLKQVVHLQDMHKNWEYHLERTSFYLFDELRTLSKVDTVVSFSANEDFNDFLESVAKQNGFKHISIDMNSKQSDLQNLFQEASLIVFDFGFTEKDASNYKQEKVYRINKSILDLADCIPIGKRVALIRAQNWAIRSLVISVFSVQLFNNYASLLTGVRAQKGNKINYLQSEFIKSCLRFEFGQEIDRTTPLMLLYFKIKSFIPTSVKRRIRNQMFR